MQTFKQFYLTELFQTMPSIDTTAGWKFEDIGGSHNHPNIEAKEIFYYPEIEDKKGRLIMYEFAAVVASLIPGKQITQKDIMFAGRTYAENLPAAEVSFTTMNHPVHSKSLTMVGDANPVNVLNHALAFIRDLIVTYKLNLVSFSASSKKVTGGIPSAEDDALYSDSREKVYERLVKRFADQLGFKYEKRNTQSTHSGHSVHASADFILIRKQI